MKLTDVQREIVEAPLGPAIVTAGAGSGKTRVLTHRLAYLMSEGGIPDIAILALTFTNKAAAEMKRRVESLTGGTCRAFLGTFHSWCARFLRKHIKPPFNSNFTIYDTKDSAKVYKEVGEGNVEMYKRRLAESNALDFDDLLEMTCEILATDSEVLEIIQQQIQYVLVDEFQDTNDIQYKIVHLLAKQHKNLMVVGDEDQCIYTWRGASIENLKLFLRDFPDARIYKLEENFRSSKNIVGMANRLVSENYNRLDKVLFSNLPDGTIEIKQHYDERAEARDIAMNIATAHHRDGAGYGDFAVLMRLNATSRILEEQFNTFNIPYLIWGGIKFYERAEVKSAINYLRVLVNPRDEVAFTAILNYPRRGIGDATIDKLRSLGNLYDVVMRIGRDEPIDVKLTSKVTTGLKDFVHTFNSLRDIHDNFGLHALASSLISTIGLDQVYATGKEEDFARLENLYQFVQSITSFVSDNPNATLAMYLQGVSLVQDTDSGAPDDCVIISTVHSAKGLEFKNVFLIALEDGIFPLQRAKHSTHELEEERRLMYVAITRARQNLYLSHCMSRFYQGERLNARPSQFLEECGFDVKPKNRFGGFGGDDWGEDNNDTGGNKGLEFDRWGNVRRGYFRPKHSDEWHD